MKSAKLFFVFVYNVHEENMFTIKVEDWREAPYKPSQINTSLDNAFKGIAIFV